VATARRGGGRVTPVRAGAAVGLAVSFYPSMLPRSPLVQLLESVVLVLLGAGLGRLLGTRRRSGGPALAAVTAVAVLAGLAWQGHLREAVGPAPVAAGSVRAGSVGAGSVGAGSVGAVPAGGVHVAVPLDAAPTPTGRAAAGVTALAEAGGLDRGTVVVLVPTGSGWVDESALATLDAVTDGDAATLAVAYDDVPSWQAYLGGPDRAVAATSDVLRALDTALDGRPRPRILLYGQSLGALVGAAAWSTVPDAADGALWVGPPVGTGPSPGPAVVLVHDSDPAAVWSPRLAVAPPPPGTLEDLPRPPWLPGVSFLQASVDLPGAVGAPAGHGHHYGAEQGAGWERLVRAPRAA
jgi:uncharacterized membrane protein